MPFSFLAPVFLAGLAALAIPVLIHLANRPKKEVVRFPSLMFLERVEYRASSRRRLRHLVLFVLRSLALVLLVAAFARPFIDRPDAPALPVEGGREVVILFDRSGSMAVADRMERAREAVADVADGLRRGDRATLVTFDRDAAVVAPATDQPAVLRRAADTVRAGAGATRMAPALRLAESILNGSPLPRRELMVVSDFQQAGWDPADAPAMPAGTRVRTVAVGEPVGNLFVADARFGRERFAGRDRVRVEAVVAGRGGPTEATVALELEGRVLARSTVRIPDGGTARAAFDPVTLPDRPVRGAIRTGTDAMPGDNVFHFVLSSSRSFRVLLATAPGAGPYLQRALAVDPAHGVAAVRVDRLTGAELAGVDVVAMDGDPGPEALERLERWVQAGGGLVAILGPRSRESRWNDVDLLPGELGGTRLAADGVGLVGLATDHPVLEPFRSAGAGLSGARFYRYRELTPTPEAAVLARFPDGAPALAARSVGQGRVVTLAAPLDGEWSDLVLQPAFVPLVHRLVRWSAGREAAPPWRTVGDLLDVGAHLVTAGSGEGGAAPVLLTPSNRALPVERGAIHRLEERGVYELRDPGSGGAPVVLAVNGDPSESEPALADTAAVRAVLTTPRPASAARASFAPEERERRQRLWWWFLAGAFGLLAAETAVSNGLSRRVLRIDGGET